MAKQNIDQQKTLAVLGCGNMAQAVLLPLAKLAQSLRPKVFTYTPSNFKAEDLAQKIQGKSFADIFEIPESDFYLLGMKPQQFAENSSVLRKVVAQNSVVISLLAGTSVSSLQKHLKTKKIIRAMPNTPCILGQGVVAIFFSQEITEEEKEFARKLFLPISLVLEFKEEEKIDQITNITASGPAYFFEIVRLLSLLGPEKIGLSKEESQLLVAKTMLGAAHMLLQSGESAETLRNKVTSKKGVTYEALKVFENQNLENIIKEALARSYNRVLELKLESEKN